MKKILILASNPRKDLNLDREIRDLEDVIDHASQHEKFQVVIELAVRVTDLQNLMFQHSPQIVHFCGHGGGLEGLVFENDLGQEQQVKTEALANLFRLFADRIECILLNACYSEVQANTIVEHINYVVGMKQAIRDDAAIAFSKGFYRALGYACSIDQAFEFGCNAIQLEIDGKSTVRSAETDVARKAEVIGAIQNTVIPEHLKPVINKKLIQTPISIPAKPLSPKITTAIRLDVAQAVAKNSDVTPSQPRHLPKFLLGGLVVCLIPAIGLYSYQLLKPRLGETTTQPLTITPKNIIEQPKESPIDSSATDKALFQQAKDSAKQGELKSAINMLKSIPRNSPLVNLSDIQFYLDTYAEKLLKRSQTSYSDGGIEDALSDVKFIVEKFPPESPIYQSAQTSITGWNQEKKDFKEAIEGLDKEWDLKGAKRLLAKIQNPDLRHQVEAKMAVIDAKNQQKIFDDLIKILDQRNITKAKELLEKITNPDLHAKAEDKIKAVETEIQTPTKPASESFKPEQPSGYAKKNEPSQKTKP